MTINNQPPTFMSSHSYFRPLILLLLTIGIVGYLVTWYLSYRQHDLQSFNAMKYSSTLESASRERHADSLREQIKTKIAWLTETNRAVMDMRQTRYLIELKCRHHQTINAYDQAVLRFKARDQVARAFTGSRYIFNDNVQATALKLTALDESNQNVCAKSAPSDVAYLQLQREIVTLMGKSIQTDEKLLNQL